MTKSKKMQTFLSVIMVLLMFANIFATMPQLKAAPELPSDPNIDGVTDINGVAVSDEGFTTSTATHTAPARPKYSVMKVMDVVIPEWADDPNGYYVYYNVAGIKEGDAIQVWIMPVESMQWEQIQGAATQDNTARVLLKSSGTMAVYRVSGTSGGSTTTGLTLKIPVTKIIDGDVPTNAETFTFNIAANEQTPDAPLPASTTCTVSGAGDTAFDPISFNNVGRYYYDITEFIGATEGYKYDAMKNTVCVEAAHNSDAWNVSIVAIWKEGREGKVIEGNAYFTNTYTEIVPGSLELSKAVTGELADHNAEFTFTVSFSDTNYTFNGGTYGTITNGVGTITLKHGQHVTFTGIMPDTTYTIEETNGEAYTATVNNNGTQVESKKVTGTVANNASVTVAYVNDLQYIPVVGLSFNTLPFILLGMFSLCGIAFIAMKKIIIR